MPSRSGTTACWLGPHAGAPTAPRSASAADLRGQAFASGPTSYADSPRPEEEADMPETIAFLQPLSEEMRKVVESTVPEGFRIISAASTTPEHLQDFIGDSAYAVVWDI